MKSLVYLLSLLPLTLAAQKGKAKKDTEFYLLYDGNWNPCSADSAKYLAYIRKVDDTTYQWHNYNFTGPLITIETYRDEAGTIPHGYFAYFDSSGNIDSSGYSFAGRKHGSWYYYTDSLTISKEEKYEQGKLIEKINTADKIRDTTHYQGDREARFSSNGDENEWRKYIGKKFQFPDRAINLGKGGNIFIGFRIDPAGKVRDIHILRSVEYSLDKEALRIISESPDWIPAEQHGRKVNAYRKQPITFLKPG